MKAEASSKVDISSLTIRDLASASRSDIEQFARTLPDSRREPDKIKRALTNVALIRELGSIFSVETFLKKTGAEVEILAHRSILLGMLSLYFDSEGFTLKSHLYGDIYPNKRTVLDDAELRDMLKGPDVHGKKERTFVNELSHLKPAKIVDRFFHTFSTPIRIK